MSRANVESPKAIRTIDLKVVFLKAPEAYEQTGSVPDCHLYLTNKMP
jgi:hypothetical protein